MAAYDTLETKRKRAPGGGRKPKLNAESEAALAAK